MPQPPASDPNHPMLDNPFWHALTTEHAHFAIGDEHARRYPAQVSPIVALAHGDEAGYAALKQIVAPGEMVGGWGFVPPFPAPWRFVFGGVGWQMICPQPMADRPLAPDSADTEVVILGLADAEEMMALVALAQPGPFMARTVEMGRYLGIRVAGQLVSMAGERARLSGYCEISAVCTHPDHLGKGYASHLVTRLVNTNFEQGILSFLHVDSANVRALGMYEHLGFVHRRSIKIAAIQYTDDVETP